MESDFDSLEGKVDQMIALCAHLSAANQALSSRVHALEAEKLVLQGKMDTARARLEAVMTQLPEQ